MLWFKNLGLLCPLAEKWGLKPLLQAELANTLEEQYMQ